MTTHTDELGFLSAIVACPEDDTARLVYADWLEEHDETVRVTCKTCGGKGRKKEVATLDDTVDEVEVQCWFCHGTGEVESRPNADRAEFIRVQVENARYGCTFAQTPEQPGWRHLCGTDEKGYWLCTNSRLRGDELLEQHGREWSRWACLDCKLHERRYACTTCGNTDSETGNLFRNRDPQFRRGFVYRVTVPTSAELVETNWEGMVADVSWKPRPLLTALAQTTVEEVWVRDREPIHRHRDAHSPACMGKECWEWWRGDYRHEGVPSPLFDWMWEEYPDHRDPHSNGRGLEFRSESEARSVLGRAHIAFGQKGVRR